MEKSPGSSPEFEFWMVSNPPSFPQPQHLLSADELFADGVILPLTPPLSSSPPDLEANPNPNPKPPHPPPSKKWRHIFRSRNGKRPPPSSDSTKDAKSKTTPTTSSSSSVGSSAELNIHIWPFSRSRSSGSVVAARPRVSVSGRRSYSAPCSRSNSRGETPPSRRWGPLAGGGIHVGRSMPVWQLRRGVTAGGGKKSGGINLNVNTCIGYGSTQVGNCRVEDKDEVTGGDRNIGINSAGGGAGGGRSGSLFNLRAIFSKKVY